VVPDLSKLSDARSISDLRNSATKAAR
jgi:hypothetical protein